MRHDPHRRREPTHRLTRRLAEVVSATLTYVPLKYLTGFERGQAVIWELRKTGPERHAEIRAAVEAALVKSGHEVETGDPRIELKLTNTKPTVTRVFLFVHLLNVPLPGVL